MRLSDLAQTYQCNQPFPHVVVDNFLNPALLDEVLAEWPKGLHRKDADNSVKCWLSHYDSFPPSVKRVVDHLNGPAFIGELEALTGFEGLIPDPHFLGGGLHHIPRGGRLGVHVDFNWHEGIKALRRLNLLLYLNKDWEWGGNLALFDRQRRRVKEIAPIFNRCVIFTTSDDSWHGHPEPLDCPDGEARRSIALYYYQKAEKPLNVRTTVYVREASNR